MRLTEVTSALQAEGKKALVPFFTAGYPDDATFLRLVSAAGDAGCRIIEIGIPFSDPIADGPVIQASSQAALADGMSLSRALDLAAEASRSSGAALVMMGYLNPLLRFGLQDFARSAHAAGVAGVIIPDVPWEESAAVRSLLAGEQVTLVDLVAPTSSDERLARITADAHGFLYLVAVAGVTGNRSASAEELAHFVGRVRSGCDLPLYVGFGVASREQAAQTTAHADGVIIGSALIRMIQEADDTDTAIRQVGKFLADIDQALNGKQGKDSTSDRT